MKGVEFLVYANVGLGNKTHHKHCGATLMDAFYEH